MEKVSARILDHVLGTYQLRIRDGKKENQLRFEEEVGEFPDKAKDCFNTPKGVPFRCLRKLRPPATSLTKQASASRGWGAFFG